MKRALWICRAFAALAVASCWGGVGQAQLTTLALTGETWPEAGGAQLDEILYANFNNRGLVAVNLEFGGPGDTNFHGAGIWKLAAGDRELLLRGTVTVDGRDYILDRGDTEGLPSDHGDMLFTKMAVFGGEGVLRRTPDGNLHVVHATGLPINGSDPLWSSEAQSRPDASGNIVFGGITSNPVTQARHLGIWLSRRDGSTRTLLHDGHVAHTAADGRMLAAPELIGANDRGITYFGATTDAVADAGRMGVWRLDTRADGNAQQIISPTFVLPGTAGTPGLANIVRGQVNGTEQFAVIGSLQSRSLETTTPADYGLWVQRTPDVVELVARGGETLAGHEGLGAIRDFGHYALQMNDGGDVLVSLTFGTGPSRRNAWLLNRPGTGSVLVATSGPGAWNVANPSYSEAWLDAHGRVFLHLRSGEYEAIRMRDVDGSMTTIVETGDYIAVAPGDFRRVESLPFWWIDVNDRGQVLFVADFSDGSHGLVLSSVAVPEPVGIVPQAIGVSLLLAAARTKRRRRTSRRATHARIA